MKHKLYFFYDSIKTLNTLGHWGIFTLLIAVVVSCTQPKSTLTQYGPVFENVMLSDVGAFRGLNFGDSLGHVRAIETAKPIEQEVDYLYYEYKMPTQGSFNVAYNFDERGLSEIHSDIFITNSPDAEGVFNKFKTYFDQHYGSSQTEMGFTAWSVKSDKYGDVKINLSNESADFTTDKAPGKISIWIYPDKN